ncbi:IS630 family transposase [Deinococcus pimensis]|uniref:IS630 family transposase n=1 Tax=Deinococcus pimensis TaxID=309888 RepID=UPI001B7FDEEE|nr:IS630 family transposase [Deinococcus pimensis]
MNDSWRPTLLTRPQLEQRRYAAASLIRQGHYSQRDLAALFGVTVTTIQAWTKRFHEGGVAAFRATVSSGRPPRLDDIQRRHLIELLQNGAMAQQHTNAQWTSRRVRDLIGREFGVWYHPDHVRKLLRALGWSYQKPQKRAIERDEAVIEKWLHVTRPALEKKSGKPERPWCISMRRAAA